MDIFFHCYCSNHFASLLTDKLNKIKISNLYNNVNKIYIVIYNVEARHEEFLKELKDVYSKIEYAVVTNAQFKSEPDTLNLMLKKANEYNTNTPLLYIHTKGVSHTHPTLSRNIAAWSRYLDLYNIQKWEECVEALNTHDVAGGFYVPDPKHFSGNFWWANSDYLKTLPRLSQYNIDKYNRGEFWICSDTEKIYPVSMNAPVDLYHNYYFKQEDFPPGW